MCVCVCLHMQSWLPDWTRCKALGATAVMASTSTFFFATSYHSDREGVCVCVVLIIMWGKRFFLNHFEGMTFIRVVQVLFPVDNLSESEIEVMYCHCDTAQILYLVLQFMKKIQ